MGKMYVYWINFSNINEKKIYNTQLRIFLNKNKHVD